MRHTPIAACHRRMRTRALSACRPTRAELPFATYRFKRCRLPQSLGRSILEGNALRVLHITTEYPPIVYGGLGTAVGGLVAASAEAGLEVAVLLVGHGCTPGYCNPELALTGNGDISADQHRNVTIWSVPH